MFALAALVSLLLAVAAPATAANATAGWVLAAPGEKRCDLVCAKLGKTCNVRSMQLVTTPTIMENVNGRLGFPMTCNSYGGMSVIYAPAYNNGIKNCNIQASKSTCGSLTAITLSNNLQRICCCASAGCPITAPAGTHCVMSAWSAFGPCSTTCGRGAQTRSRSVITPSTGFGRPCGELTRTRRCSDRGCPVACALGSWTPWSSCSASCDHGYMQRSRQTVVKSRNNGRPCDDKKEWVACTLGKCPVSSPPPSTSTPPTTTPPTTTPPTTTSTTDDCPCQNGGVCIDDGSDSNSNSNSGDGFICACLSLFTGQYCETLLD